MAGLEGCYGGQMELSTGSGQVGVGGWVKWVGAGAGLCWAEQLAQSAGVSFCQSSEVSPGLRHPLTLQVLRRV